jgi:hypothetical protein
MGSVLFCEKRDREMRKRGTEEEVIRGAGVHVGSLR